MKRNIPILLFVYAACAARLLSAQISNCEGTWTNRPCPGKGAATISEFPVRERSEMDRNMDKKKLWVHDLEMRILKARRSSDVQVDPATAADICLRPETSLDDCSRALSLVQGALIDQLVLKSETSRKSGSDQGSGEQSGTGQQNNTVVVIDNRDDGYCDPLELGGCRRFIPVHPGGGGGRDHAGHRPPDAGPQKPAPQRPDRQQPNAPPKEHKALRTQWLK